MGGRDHPQNPSWSGERRSPAGCVAPPPALERVLAGALPPPAHVPEHPRVPGAAATHHTKHGVVEAFVTGWVRGRHLLCSVPGPGEAQGGQSGERPGHHPPAPLPSQQLPQPKHCIFKRWMGKYGGKVSGCLKRDVCTLSQGKPALSSRNH